MCFHLELVFLNDNRAYGSVFKASFIQTGYVIAAKKIVYKDKMAADAVTKEIAILKATFFVSF